jgi:hypothetical protein
MGTQSHGPKALAMAAGLPKKTEIIPIRLYSRRIFLYHL